MIKTLAVMAAFASLGACTQPATTSTADGNSAAPASDAAIPDLKGTWKGTSESIVTGAPMHHAAQSGDAPLLDNVEFTFAITGQDGHRFWGTVTSPGGKEVVTGVILRDGKTVVGQDSDGQIHGTLTDADTIDLVYNHGGTSSVVALNTIKRQK